MNRITYPAAATFLVGVAVTSACGRLGFESLDEQRVGAAGGTSAGAGGDDAGADGDARASAGADAGRGGNDGSGGIDGNGGTGAGGGGGAGGTNAGGTDTGGTNAGGTNAGGANTGGTNTGGTNTGGGGGAGGAYVCTPGATETCDGRDNDCNASIDEGAPCPGRCSGTTWGGHGYMFCDTNDAQGPAEALCVAEGMHLVAIDSQAENDFVASLVGTIRVGIWTGASDPALVKDFRWPDGTAFWSGGASPAGSAVNGAYANWGPNEPDGIVNGGGTDAQCVILMPDGTWDDQACRIFASFVCEGP